MLRRNFVQSLIPLSLFGCQSTKKEKPKQRIFYATQVIKLEPSKPLDLFKEDKTELKTIQMYKVTSDKNVTYQYFKEYSLTNKDYMSISEVNYVLVPLFKTRKYNTLEFQAKLDLLRYQNKLAGDCLLEFAKNQKEFKLDNSSDQLKNMTNSIKNHLGNDCQLFFHNDYMIGVAKSEFYKPCTDIYTGESCLSDNQTKVYFAHQDAGFVCINGKTACGKIS